MPETFAPPRPQDRLPDSIFVVPGMPANEPVDTMSVFDAPLGDEYFHNTVEKYKKDPLRFARDNRSELFQVLDRDDLNIAEKREYLDMTLDDYFDLLEDLDHSAFPNNETIDTHVPRGYVPDGFIDMGSNFQLDPGKRFGRALNYVDQRQTLARWKTTIADAVISVHEAGLSGTEMEMALATKVALDVYFGLPYGEPAQQERGSLLPLSGLERAVCQQHSLTSQVLLQALGVESRLSKNMLKVRKDTADTTHDSQWGDDHASNFIRVGETWYIFDATNPILNDNRQWRPGVFRISGTEQEDFPGEWVVDTPGGTRTYTQRQTMYSTTLHPLEYAQQYVQGAS